MGSPLAYLSAAALSAGEEWCSWGTLSASVLLIAIGVVSFISVLVGGVRFFSKKEVPHEEHSHKDLLLMIGGTVSLTIIFLIWLIFLRQEPSVFARCFTLRETENILAVGTDNSAAFAPVLLLVGSDPQVVYVGEEYRDLGAQAFLGSEDISRDIETQGLPVATDAPGAHYVIYYVIAPDGTAYQLQRTVYVVEKGTSLDDILKLQTQNQSGVPKQNGVPGTEATYPPNTGVPADGVLSSYPVITLRGSETIHLVQGSSYIEQGATAYDARDGDISDKITVRGAPTDTDSTGLYTITYTVTNSQGKKASARRSVFISPTALSRPSITDADILRSCIGESPRGFCKNFDFNGDGIVKKGDASSIIDLLERYDVNADAIIEFSLKEDIYSCFLKISEEACALDTQANTVITMSYLQSVESLIDQSQGGAPDTVNVNSLKTRLGNTVLDTIAFYTVAQYDLNKDGIIELSEGGSKDFSIVYSCLGAPETDQCKKADINKDGTVTAWDLSFITNIQSTLLPQSFTVAQFEYSLFDANLYTDAEIIRHCILHQTKTGNCENADINKDSSVNSADLTLFFKTTAMYDVNGDGMLNGEVYDFVN